MEAIVLGLIRHTDKASVLRCYTRAHGRINYIVYGSRQRLAGVCNPLSVVDITVAGKIDPAGTTMPVVKEMTLTYVPQQLNTDVRRQSVALFMAEILSNLLVHPLGDEQLYAFLCDTVTDLDRAEDIADVHLRFLRTLCTYMGFTISEEEHLDLLAQPRTRDERQSLLKALCTYIEENADGFRAPKSLDVLMELFD